jgi:hypothetical protein
MIHSGKTVKVADSLQGQRFKPQVPKKGLHVKWNVSSFGRELVLLWFLAVTLKVPGCCCGWHCTWLAALQRLFCFL